jgi:enoyl-CoA hydratase
MNTPQPALTCFSVSLDAHIAHLVLNKPEALNTMHPLFWRELDAALTWVNKTGEARVLLISSTGKHFSAGMALETFGGEGLMDEKTAEGRAAIHDNLLDIQATFTKLEKLRIPVIVAIQGGCIGGGVDFVTACCIRYATADAFFCIQEINIGLVADVGTLQRLPKLIPLGIVKELAYTGRRFPASRALACGLVNEVFESHAAMLEAASQCAREIAAKPPVAIWGTKQVVHYARDHTVDEALLQMGWVQGAVWSNANVMEAVTAMKEKRAGSFADLPDLRRFNDIGL